MQTVQNRTKRLKKPQIKIVVRAHIEPPAGKRVLLEPVFHLMQTVQNRTKRLKKVQVNFLPRVLIEPDVGKRVHREPPASKKGTL